MVNVENANSASTVDIEVRVGNVKPFPANTNGNSLITSGTVCGFFEGPAQPSSTSSVACSNPLIGRYITLQRVKVQSSFGLPLIWREVLLDTKTAQAGEVMTVMTRDENDQCPSSHPYAFNYGKDCCENKKLLHFGSNTYQCQ